MKSLFSIFTIFLSLNTYSSAIKVYYPTKKQVAAAVEVRRIFNEKYLIPKQLITIEVSDHCRSQDMRFLELCVSENFKLVEIKNIRSKEIKKSLMIFVN